MALSATIGAVPKVSGLVNDRERAICDRLRRVRLITRFTQGEFARALGSTLNQIVGSEYGRKPLRYWFADRACDRFNLCQLWLATGEGGLLGYVKLPLETGLQIDAGELFSGIWDRFLGHHVKKVVLAKAFQTRIFSAYPGAAAKAKRGYLRAMLQSWFDRLPPELYADYFGELMAKSSEFCQQHGLLRLVPELRKENDKSLLTQVDVSANITAVRTPMENLMARLNAATKARGKKTELAKALGIPLETVSRYLAGNMEPGGEVTLRLLKWVEQEEAKQQSPGSVVAPPGHKTQRRRSRNENQTSDPRKK